MNTDVDENHVQPVSITLVITDPTRSYGSRLIASSVAVAFSCVSDLFLCPVCHLDILSLLNLNMNDAQVQGEMRKMTAFIRQEALEKSKEIHIKADEEFAIEKAKLVRTEQSKIDESYETRTKKAGMSQQIARSTVLNKQRLRILAARQEVLDDIFEEARKQLSSIPEDKAKYATLVEQLLLQVQSYEFRGGNRLLFS